MKITVEIGASTRTVELSYSMEGQHICVAMQRLMDVALDFACEQERAASAAPATAPTRTAEE